MESHKESDASEICMSRCVTQVSFTFFMTVAEQIDVDLASGVRTPGFASTVIQTGRFFISFIGYPAFTARCLDRALGVECQPRV